MARAGAKPIVAVAGRRDHRRRGWTSLPSPVFRPSSNCLTQSVQKQFLILADVFARFSHPEPPSLVDLRDFKRSPGVRRPFNQAGIAHQVGGVAVMAILLIRKRGRTAT